MRRILLLLGPALMAAGSLAQTPAAPTQIAAPAAPSAQPSAAIQKKVEEYMRHLYAWGPTFHLQFGPLKESPLPGLYEFTIEVAMGDQSDTGTFYVSKDGRYLVRGDIQDMSQDPLAAVRAQLRLADAPSKGPTNAPVTLVEFADFQCPSCRELYRVLKELEPRYPQIRLVFKDFPLTQLHPWAMTGATAGRCAYQQNHAAFWKLYDNIYENQELISTENAWQKMLDFAEQAGLDSAAFRTCMSDPSATAAINQSIQEGQKLKIANTPTLFVNGRRLIGPDRTTLEQFIQYELSARPQTPPASPRSTTPGKLP
jgi:protein-disulfide isomerase